MLIEERPAHQGGDVIRWWITFQRMFDMSNELPLFRTPPVMAAEGWSRYGADWVPDNGDGAERRVPLYEAKMIHHRSTRPR